MDTWKMQLVVVTFCTLLQTCQGLTASEEEERGLSTDWQDGSQTPMETDVSHLVASLMKRSKALRFYGLMGKRSSVKKPFKVNRRNKGDTFVGLMGRSLSSGESLTRINPSATTTGVDVSEKPHKQGSSEEWIQILY
ncbi:protachykinin-1 [Limanda limanda]|uniref:protachykinin-1 n=1 Tax=Limanda limanda TaxID=27771 RepID=UPI0029C819C9|nr:protachykinin-1 [Limanda limanda]